MSFPTLSLDPALAALWPAVRLGVLIYTIGVTPSGVLPDGATGDAWTYYKDSVEAGLTAALASTDLAAMPGIGDARAAFKRFGADPGRYRVSSEALYRRVRQGKDLYRVNSLVDVNNIISLETGFSLGSYDASKVEGDVVLRKGADGETYDGIGKGSVPLANMPILSDALGAFGSPVSDSVRALITEETVSAFTVIYCFTAGDALGKALALAADRLTVLAGARNLSSSIIG